ncbi:hypothetical protein CI109_106140 [Kwoniella shandongensis]|uniref:Uncharacterized protein n=1 Tax=Kwoniella shandongensis TaxID=1734106 RepID=A0A5M6BY61_9TREE|nr:uncharacterized protein CI109_003747 [Kwoniella shandongensis]KAA5527776.1 hypothetical protein CI109_003747 [Kwoniella shandongensis]
MSADNHPSSSSSHPPAPSLAPPIHPSTSEGNAFTAPATTPSHPLDPNTPAQTTTTTASVEQYQPPAPVIESITPAIPKVHLRALLISGQSHVYSFEPEITVGRMKELIWSSWPSEWTDNAQPSSPSSMRILHAGRILQDDSTLMSNNLPANVQPTLPTVVHISIRSFSLKGDDDPKKPGLLHRTASAARSHRNDEEVGGCRCVIM